jgi:low affinity Fe/Cu permease
MQGLRKQTKRWQITIITSLAVSMLFKGQQDNHLFDAKYLAARITGS